MDLEKEVLIRIQVIDLDILSDAIGIFQKCGVPFYNNQGEFKFDKFKKDCIKTSKLLYKNDKPINGIRYQLCYFMSAVQTLVGVRNMNKFMS